MDVRILSPDTARGVGRAIYFEQSWIACPVRAWAAVGELDAEYLVDIDERADPPRLACMELTLRARPGGSPVTSSNVRVRVDELVREAARRAATPRRAGSSPTSPPAVRRGRKPAVPDDELLAYLKVYDGDGMRAAMSRWRLVSESTAKRTARRARLLRGSAT